MTSSRLSASGMPATGRPEAAAPPSGPPSRPPVRTRRWRAGSALGEGLRAAWNARGLATVAVVVMAWATAVMGAADAASVDRLVNQERAWVAAGGRVLVVSNERAGGIPAAACDRLANLSGVVAAAAVTRRTGPVSPVTAPDLLLSLTSASPGGWALLGRRDPGPGTVGVPAGTAGRLGLRTGDSMSLVPQPAAVVQAQTGAQSSAAARTDVAVPTGPYRVVVLDLSVLGDALAEAILLPQLATGRADECFVDTAAGRTAAVRAALPSLLSGGDSPAVVADRLVQGRFRQDFVADYRSRPLRWGPPALGCVLGMLALMLRWSRRSQDALYATLGADLRTRALIRGSEWCVLCTTAAGMAFALGVTAALVMGVERSIAVAYVGRTTIGALSVATCFVALALIVRPRSLLADLKDR